MEKYDFINCYIVSLAQDNKEIPVTFENFCETVFLEYFEIEEDEEDVE